MAVCCHESLIRTLDPQLAHTLFPEGSRVSADITTISTDGGGSLCDFAVLILPNDPRLVYRCDEVLNQFRLRHTNDEFPVIVTLVGDTLTVGYDLEKVTVHRGPSEFQHTFA